MQKCGKTIEVGDRIGRPVDPHFSDQGLNSGVPHVRSQRSTLSCATVCPPFSTAAQRRSNSAIASSSIASGTSSATSYEALTPRSAAHVLRTDAASLSTSMDSVLTVICKG
jgi:hypothetical protein